MSIWTVLPLQLFGTGQNLKLSLSECLKVRCGIWLICLCDLAFLRSLSEPFSEISALWRHVAPTFCPAESAVPVLVIAWGRTREMRSRCPVSDWDQNPAIKRLELPQNIICPKVLRLIFFFSCFTITSWWKMEENWNYTTLLLLKAK